MHESFCFRAVPFNCCGWSCHHFMLVHASLCAHRTAQWTVLLGCGAANSSAGCAMQDVCRWAPFPAAVLSVLECTNNHHQLLIHHIAPGKVPLLQNQHCCQIFESKGVQHRAAAGTYGRDPHLQTHRNTHSSIQWMLYW
jgi:hypothetical protein